MPTRRFQYADLRAVHDTGTSPRIRSTPIWAERIRTAAARPWDLSDGPFGKWSRSRIALSPGDERLDLGTSD
jgi:hypothetical protein